MNVLEAGEDGRAMPARKTKVARRQEPIRTKGLMASSFLSCANNGFRAWGRIEQVGGVGQRAGGQRGHNASQDSPHAQESMEERGSAVLQQ